MIKSIISREELENTFYGRKLENMELSKIVARWGNVRDIEGSLREIVLTFTMPYVPKQKKKQKGSVKPCPEKPSITGITYQG